MDYKVDNLTFIRSDGHRLAGRAYIPAKEGDAVRYPAVIFAHGFNSGMRYIEHHGKSLVEQGIVCVFFDFYGGASETESDGKLTDMTILTEKEDYGTVLDAVAKLPYVDADRIGIQGESQGGLVAAMMAVERPIVKAMVLWYPAFVIPSDSTARYERNDNTRFGTPISPYYNRDSKDIDIYELMNGYDGPVLLIHGDRDGLVPLSYSEAAQEHYKNARLIVLPGAGHGFDGPDSLRAGKESAAFFAENL